MTTVWYFWYAFIHRGTTFMYLQYSRSLIYHVLQNIRKASYTISVSIFVDIQYWSPYSTDTFFSCVVPAPLQWFFHFGEDIVNAWTPYRVSTVDVPESPIASSTRGPWQQQCDYLHCHEEWWSSVPPSTSRSPWKHSCVLRLRVISILTRNVALVL